MSQRRTVRTIAIGACISALSACGLARADETVVLGKRYVDSLHGFSLRPPVGTERKRGFSPSRLVSWSRRDPASGAIVWTLTVLHATERKKQIDLGPYSKALADKLRKEDNFKMESLELSPVAGKPAIHLRGLTAGVKMWQRQVWILARPSQFLIVMISGPETIKDRLETICRRVLGTLQLTDPTKARETQRKNLSRGRGFLSDLNDKRFAGAIQAGPTWFLLKYKGRDVGFRRVTEAPARREDVDGYLVKMWVMLALAKTEVRLLKHEMFVAADLGVERWRKRIQIGSGKAARVIDEEGLKQNELIVCNVLLDRRMTTRKKEVNEAIYLPQAAGMLLGRLIDLKTPAAYAFAVYDSEQNGFDMRTFTVVGPATIELAGRRVDAVRATDRPAMDAEPATLYLDAKGRLLRMETIDGLVMVRSTAGAVRRRFPKADVIVKEMGE